MKKLESPVRYMLSVFVLLLAAALCRLLPSRLLEWQDEKQIGKSYVQPARPVTARAPEGMTILEKVSLFHNGPTTILKVSDGKGYTSDEEAAAQAEKELRKLAKMGVLTDFGPDPISLYSAETMFLIDREDSGRSMLVWYGTFTAGDDLLTWYMDDETGSVLGVIQLSMTQAEQWGDIGAYSFPDGLYGHFDQNTAVTDSGERQIERLWENEDEVKKCGEKWAEYLGCEVREAGYARGYRAMDQEWSGLVRSLMEDSGLNAEEAYFEAGRMMGYSWEFMESLWYVAFEDGGNRAVCFCNILPYGRCIWRFGDGTEIIW